MIYHIMGRIVESNVQPGHFDVWLKFERRLSDYIGSIEPFSSGQLAFIPAGNFHPRYEALDVQGVAKLLSQAYFEAFQVELRSKRSWDWTPCEEYCFPLRTPRESAGLIDECDCGFFDPKDFE